MELLLLILLVLGFYVTSRMGPRKYTPPTARMYTDECGRRALEIHADSYRDVARFTEGTTPQGELMEVHTKVAPRTWLVQYEDWQVRDLKRHTRSGG